MHTTPPRQVSTTDRDTRHLKARVTLIGALVNLLLAGIKIMVGLIGHSQALVADGVHSLSDLLSDALVLFATHFGSKAADAEHPYGHARFETAATVVIGVMLLIVAGGFIYDAALRLIDPSRMQAPAWIVLPAAVLSVLAKEALYQYTARTGRRVNSPLIEANAWHHRSDALSSLVVIAAFLGTLAGYAWLDAVAASIVATMIGVMGGQFIWQSFRELVDTGLPPDRIAELTKVIDTVDGVRGHHDLRTRLMAGKVLVDVHVLVTPWISASEGHRIGEEVHRRLSEKLDQTSEVLVHVDTQPSPSDDARPRPPLRRRLLADLHAAWDAIPEAGHIARVVLHYQNDRVQVELHLAADGIDASRLGELEQRFQTAATALPYLVTTHCLLMPSTRHSPVSIDSS